VARRKGPAEEDDLERRGEIDVPETPTNRSISIRFSELSFDLHTQTANAGMAWNLTARQYSISISSPSGLIRKTSLSALIKNRFDSN